MRRGDTSKARNVLHGYHARAYYSHGVLLIVMV